MSRSNAYTLSTEDLSNAANACHVESNEYGTCNTLDSEEGTQDLDVMEEDWTCIVVHKQSHNANLHRKRTLKRSISLPVPKAAPPPIPHARKAEIERQLQHRRRSKGWLKRKANQKNVVNEFNNEYDINTNTFSLDTAVPTTVELQKYELRGDEACEQTVNDVKSSTENSPQWQWRADNGTWQNYGTRIEKIIEVAYQSVEQRFEYAICGQRIYFIEFAEMKQYNNVKQSWNVRRINC
mmetsp:Transcript_47943/g.79521  ORF Transcript_47943/g.79521 Transcript_47943/m.79521 type:complete len:238 (+) Transcript_47943:1-714(+)